MRRGPGSRFTPFQVGLIALIVIVIGTFLGASKDIPFTKPYQLKAVFENAPPIHKGQAVRIAGVDVGKVSAVEPVGGDSPAVVVTMKLKDEALPIHKDAQIKVRPRLFFEGNLFFDIRPGTPQAGTVDDGDTIPVSQTSAPVQLDQVLGTLTTNTREDLQKLLIGYGDALNGPPQPGEDADQDPDTKGETGAQALNDSLKYSAASLRGGAVLNDATQGTELHDLSKLIGSQQKVFAALSSHEGSLKDLITNFNTTMGALASQESNLRATIHELPQVLEAARPALDNLNAAFPSTRAWAPGSRGYARPARCSGPPSSRAWWTTSSRPWRTSPSSRTARSRSCRCSTTSIAASCTRSCRPSSSGSTTAPSPQACGTTRSSSSRWCRWPASRRTSTGTAPSRASRRAAGWPFRPRRWVRRARCTRAPPSRRSARVRRRARSRPTSPA